MIASSERVALTYGNTLCESGERIQHVYFPIDCIISLLVPIDGHGSLEAGLVGTEGMFGAPIALGVDVSPLQALVQGSGAALRWSAAALRGQLAASPALRQCLHRYIYVSAEQSAQSSACRSFHRLDARLARWLLMTHDRAHSDQFHLTHEFLAQLLGVRRVGVTNAAGALQKHKLVKYSRGDITVLNRASLERTSCGCYQAAKDSYHRILGSGKR
jgi:CRP-like cAMP-binding protein